MCIRDRYYRVVRYWAKKKYNLTDQDLEILFFIYSERFFTKTKFIDYCKIFSWDKDRFRNLRKDNWIRSWRAAVDGKYALYEASFKTRRLVSEIYKKLDGTSPFSERKDQNPIFKRETYTDRRMAGQMVKINEEMKEKRLSDQEPKEEVKQSIFSRTRLDSDD